MKNILKILKLIIIEISMNGRAPLILKAIRQALQRLSIKELREEEKIQKFGNTGITKYGLKV
ncbi:hypothetical protein LJCM1025_17810 [Lactobacillus gasseri]|uniref:Uncharacterized protein n=1 Tax=Lactobacillus gasseri TaxID=1596 RepID=A0AB33ZXV8_LACGS|nr:hypothetical protein LJCM1025_17810 [Lactobacillus gasseri]